MRKPSLLWRLRRDTRGVAAIEFAMVLPILVASWFGMVQLTELSMASAKTSMAAQALADLTSRYTLTGFSSGGGFTDLLAAASTILAPLPTSSGTLAVSVVAATLGSSGTPTQAWQCTSGTNTPTNAQVTTALSLAPAVTTATSSLSSVIMVTVIYTYTPNLTGGLFGPQTFTATAYSTPRMVSSVPRPC